MPGMALLFYNVVLKITRVVARKAKNWPITIFLPSFSRTNFLDAQILFPVDLSYFTPTDDQKVVYVIGHS